MDIYDTLNLISAIINLYFTINIIVLNPKNKVTRSFAYLSLSFIGCNMSIFYIHHVESNLVFHLAIFFLLSTGILFIEFAYKFMNRPVDRISILLHIIHTINIIIAVFTDKFIKSWKITPYGIDIATGPLFLPIALFSILIVYLYGVYLLYTYKRKTKNPIMKASINIILMGVFSIVVLFLVLDFYLISIRDFIQLPSAASFTFLPSLFFYIAIKKYNFLLLKPENILPHFFNYLGEGAIILDAEGNIVDVNSILLDILNEKKENIIGKNIKFFIPNFDKTKDYLQYDIRYKNKVLRISQKRIENKGISIGYTLVVHDVTERVAIEEELRKAKEEAFQAVETERRFLSNISHEMRTPLNGIIATLDLISIDELTERQKEYLSILKTQSKALLEIINEVLDIAKIKQGRFSLNEREFDIKKLFYETISIVSSDVYKKGLELYPYISPEIPSLLIGDPIKIKEILINFLGNAIKFTEKGGIWIKVEKGNIDGNKITLKFSVKDTGIGIPPDKINTIFDKFVQVDSSLTREYRGTGLGLAISKELIKMMEGDIEVKSTPGKGSHFSFFIKLTIGKMKKNHERQQGNVLFKHALVVTKNLYTFQFLRDILKEWNIETESMYNFDKDSKTLSFKQEKIKEILDTYITDIIFFDINEEKNDKEILIIIKNNLNQKDIPLIGIVSPSLIHMLKEYKDLVNSYIVKPIRQDYLLEKITKPINGPEEDKTKEENYVFSNKYKVLLVEDNKVNQRVESILLEKMGISFDIANNGKEAVEFYQKNDYDLILMDIQMPVMDGVKATKIIREIERKKNKHTPILALSASVFKSEVKKFLEAGMDGYITKPISTKDLYEALYKFLELTQKRETSKKEKYKIFSPQVLIEDLGSREILKDIIKENLPHIKNMISQFKNLYSKKDNEGLAKIVHSMKGSIGNFIDSDMVDELIELENAIKENNMDHIDNRFKELQEKLNVLLNEMDSFLKE